ncbi:hypothetical protein CRUP_018975 [Coryphaenoides rupestris]|nr:hypothetical protein CRUP_018975 [Coryphaenoides rupestris]
MQASGKAGEEEEEEEEEEEAYKEKMKEISVLSLICSCLYPESRKNVMGEFEEKPAACLADMDIKPINKRASGQAFEVILKPPSPVSEATHCSQEAQVLRALAEKRDHERDVLLKAMEENNNFSRMAEEKLQLKMEQIEENRMAYLASIMDRLQEKVRRGGGGGRRRWGKECLQEKEKVRKGVEEEVVGVGGWGGGGRWKSEEEVIGGGEGEDGGEELEGEEVEEVREEDDDNEKHAQEVRRNKEMREEITA